MIFMLTLQVQANTMWMTRGGTNQSEDVVGADGTSGSLDLNFGFDFKNVSTNPANGSSTGDRPSFRIKTRYNGTGSSGGSVGGSVADPGLVLQYDQKDENYPLTNGVRLNLILHDGVAATTLDATTVNWDNIWHRVTIHWDAAAKTAWVVYDEITVLGPVNVPTGTYDMSGRNFVVNGYDRLEGANINFDNLRINGQLLEDFEDLTDGAGVSGDWVIRNRFDFMTVNGDEEADYFIQPPAFPGAEGYGAYANGGRGGDVYHVTNVEIGYYGVGSFFDAISTVPPEGRTIVFDVSGYIRIPNSSSGTTLSASNVTIAGQTAPGDGVGFWNNNINITGNDVIMRHLRFRRGKTESSADCIDIDANNNTMLDHISLAFSTDENFSSFGTPPSNLTFQYSLNSWGLESHSCGGLWDQNTATAHHTLWAHNHTRNPKARPGMLEWINNVTFDWDIGFIMGDSETPMDWKSNVIGNYFIGPAGNTHSKALVKGTVDRNGYPNFTVHLSSNLIDVNGDGILNGVDNGYDIVEGTGYTPGTGGLTPGTYGYYRSPSPMSGSAAGVITDSPLLAYKKIVSSAGALRLDANYSGTLRDEVDTLMINNLVTQTRFHVSDPSQTGASNGGLGTLNTGIAPTDTDGDGMPDYWEQTLGSNPFVQDHNTRFAHDGSVITESTFFPPSTPAGYTCLEEYLYFLAVPHAAIPRNVNGQPSTITVDLRKYTSGFSNNPEFTISKVQGGTIRQFAANGLTLAAAGPIVEFTPTLDFAGRAGFDFNVTDADGSSWSQSFALLVDVTKPALPMLTARYEMEGNVNDSSGNDNHGIATGSPAYSEGQVGLAIDLDGADDLVTLPAGVAGSEDITVCTWVNWDGGNMWQRIFDFGNDTSHYMFLTPYSGDSTLRFAILNGGSEQMVETTTLTTGRWTHIAVTLDGDLAVLYIDGSPVDTNNAVTINPSDFNPVKNYIGDSQWSSDPLFNGRVDDFRIYNYALTDTQIAAIAAGNTAPSFTVDPIINTDAIELTEYTGHSLMNYTSDDGIGGSVIFSKDSGPGWLTVASDGTLSGIPEDSDVGPNAFIVRAEDPEGLHDTAQMTINVANTYSGVRGMEDLAGVAGQWLMTDCTDIPPCEGADLDGDKNVTITDLAILASNWVGQESP